MFVSKTREVVYPQSEHVKFATVLAEHWGNEEFIKPPVPPESFIKAVSHHDDGYGHYDMHAVGQLTEDKIVELWQRCAEQDLNDPYADIIIRRHFMRLTSTHSKFPLLSAFNAKLAGEVADLYKKHSLDAHLFDVTDTIMNACDAISHSFCLEEPSRWELEVYKTMDEKTTVSFQIDPKNTVHLHPYPLNEVHITGTLTAYDKHGYPKILLPNEVHYQILKKA